MPRPRNSMIAVTCGTPTPATTRVVQIEPGPMPTFTASTPARIRSRVASPVATLPATSWSVTNSFRTRLHHVNHAARMPVSGIHDDQIDPRLHQRGHPVKRIGRHADGRANPQTAVLVLAGVRDA